MQSKPDHFAPPCLLYSLTNLEEFNYMKIINIADESTSITCFVDIIVGVQSAALGGQDMNHVVATGNGIDAVALTRLLRRKVGSSELMSVGPVDYGGDSLVHIPTSGYHSTYNPYGYGTGQGYDTRNQNPYVFGPGRGYDYGSGYGYETRYENQGNCFIM